MPLPDFIAEDKLNFHIPGEQGLVKLLTESLWHLYTQLVCWCLIQRFWYYVLHDPKATDTEYDAVEKHVATLESKLGRPFNKHSPTQTIGYQNSWMYPQSILMLFSKHPTFGRIR